MPHRNYCAELAGEQKRSQLLYHAVGAAYMYWETHDRPYKDFRAYLYGEYGITLHGSQNDSIIDYSDELKKLAFVLKFY